MIKDSWLKKCRKNVVGHRVGTPEGISGWCCERKSRIGFLIEAAQRLKITAGGLGALQALPMGRSAGNIFKKFAKPDFHIEPKR